MADYYLYIKTLHVTCVVISITLFLLRSMWTFQGSPMLASPWARTVPHYVDTTLLAAAILLTLIIHQYPLQASWLTAKVSGLLAHILFGLVFFHYKGSWAVRKTALLLSLLSFSYIVAVALTRNPLVFA
ncbi:MAG TPA: regulator SirB [Gammaproteobacteria bacterium]|nr:regulator SirB [Gammaproteobacteria bacterium]